MKKLLKWVFPAILGIVPALGMDKTDQFEITDAFFTQKGVVCSISQVLENEGSVIAQVSATNQTGQTQTKLVKALCATSGWTYNDAGLFAQEQVNVQVICGSDTLTKEYTKTLRTPYTFLGKNEARFIKGIALTKEESLPVGELVEVQELLNYRRPGADAPLGVPGTALYQLLLEEITSLIGSGWVAICTGCGKKDGYQGLIHKGGKHNLQAYSNARNVTHTLWQISLTGEKVKKEERTTKHATISKLYPDRRDHNIKSDLQAADYISDMTGWIIH